MAGSEPYSVTALNSAIHGLLRNEFEDIRVAGEISGFKVWTSGHAYFTLKDAGAQVRCVFFKGSMRYSRFKPVDGAAVIARGSVEVRQERGEYQLVVSSMEPQGEGALQAAFERLKQRLAAEGLFDPGRKRALPKFPRRVGIVTSPKGAAIRDMLQVMGRRWPGLEIRLYPTLVQGEGAAEGICEGVNHFSESGWADVVIVGRGGGSLEDLWPFNEEIVARAIAACSVPVVSAVGHEIDFTIADFVADLRAATPSAAAELVAPLQETVLEGLDTAATRAYRAVAYRLTRAAQALQRQGLERAANLVARHIGLGWQRLDELTEALGQQDPRVRLAGMRKRLEEARLRLQSASPRAAVAALGERVWRAELAAETGMVSRLRDADARLGLVGAMLEALSPVAVLERGYSVLTNEVGQIVKSPEDAPAGSTVRARLARGGLTAKVQSLIG